MKGSSAPLVLTAVVIIIILIGGLFIAHQNKKSPAMMTATPTNAMTQASPSLPAMNHDTSNSSIDKQMQDIQQNLDNLQSDQTNVDKSITNSSSDQLTY